MNPQENTPSEVVGSQIETVPTEVTTLAGLPDRTVVDVRQSDGTFSKEIVVIEYDANDNEIGFHKEVHNG